MKIKVREIVDGCLPIRSGAHKSDCFDLFLAEDVKLKKGELGVFSLGVAMEIPKGMSGRAYLRSSTPVEHHVYMANHVGVIDSVYCGNDDNWRVELVALKATTIPKGTKICQFELVPSQFATVYQKLKWLFSSSLTIQKVDKLTSKNRGGLGTTGK